MIYVGNRDGRKGIELGFDVRRQMEETELEEGEACAFLDDDDPSIDPDIALSYIDEKIQDVLGHFQKDFEGGVSAENLGSKYGGYGSFLPTYQRSPILSHPRSPSRAQNCHATCSPNNFQMEGGHPNYVVTSCAPQAKGEQASAGAVPLPVLALPSATDSAKRDVCQPSTCDQEFHPRSNPPDQKMLKVRIKVGSDNLSTRKNAEIYNGLGLDISPSSSLDESPTESEGFAPVPRAPDETPASILQMMTSFSLHGGLLLSPLSDDLLGLTEKENLLRDVKSRPFSNGTRDIPKVLGNGPVSVKGDEMVLGNKKTKLVGKNGFPVEMENGSRDAQKEELEMDSLTCGELVSNTLKLPMLANSFCSFGGIGKSAGRACDRPREASKGVLKDKLFSDLTKENLLEPMPDQEVGWADKPNGKAVLTKKAWEDKKANSRNDVSICVEKDADHKAEKNPVPIKADSNATKGKRTLNAEPLEPGKQNQEVASHEQDSFDGPTGKGLSSFGRRKSKGSQSHGNPALDLPKENLRVESSLFTKKKKSSNADDNQPKNEIEGFKIQKDIGKASDRYKDFFGGLKLEDEHNGMDSLEKSPDDRMDSELVEKHRSVFNNASKVRFGGKKVDKTSKVETRLNMASNAAPVSENGIMLDAALLRSDPAEDDDWVCCDQCQKWRLLPIGSNPNALPDKWVCSMLDCLPGMNRCSISEEETRKAVLALNQAFALENQNNMDGHGDGIVAAVNLADAWNLDQNRQNHSFHSVPSSAKKKHKLKEVSTTAYHDGHTQFSNSMKNLQTVVKNRSSYDVNQLPVMNELDIQHVSRTNYLPTEKHRNKQKEKHRICEHSSHGGESKTQKMESRREIGQDCSRVRKKIKREGMLATDGEWMSNHVGTIEKLSPSSGSGLPADAALRDHPKYKKRSSFKDLKHEANDNLHISVRKQRLDDRTIDKVNRDNTDFAKKRKERNHQDNGICSGSFPSSGHLPQYSRGSIKEEAGESDKGKKKKLRLLKCERAGRESNASKANGRTDRKVDSMKDLPLGQDMGNTLPQRSLDGMHSLKRDMGSQQPSVVATSSSSKVSGSHKTKANFQELKGSPVESVSSSPLRISNPDISTSRRKIFGKVDSQDCDFRDRDFSPSSGSKAIQKIHVPDIKNHDVLLCVGDASDNFHNEEAKNENHYQTNGSHPRKSGKGSSSQSKDNERSCKSEFDHGKIKIADSSNGYQDYALQDRKREGENMSQEKIGSKSDKVDKSSVGKKGQLSSENSKREGQSKYDGCDGPDVKVGNICSQNAMPNPNQNQLLDHDDERFSKRFHSDKIDKTEVVSGRGNSLPLPPSRGGENGTLSHCHRPVSGSQNRPGPDLLSVDASEGDDGLLVAKPNKKVNNLSGTQHTSSRQSTPNGHRARETDARSPVRRDSTSQVVNSVLKEAKNLKHMADRQKNSGSNLESTGLYFQAALKFLHAASLLESCNGGGTKQADMFQSMQIYSSTAKLCEFCAHEYERFKDMAAAALAYKCIEVAYMRVICSSHTIAGRDRHELQLALWIVPPGESPSSSASDVDNLNNPLTADKVALVKGVSSPQVPGNHVIAARNRSNFLRLLTFAQDVNFAMEASRKSRIAFAAANANLENAQCKEGISSIKAAIDFNFQDVEGLLRLVRLAMEAFSRG